MSAWPKFTHPGRTGDGDSAGATAVEQRAADWLARRNGGLTAVEQAHFAGWLARDPKHAAAFAAMEQVWHELNAARDSGQADRVWREIEIRQRRRAHQRRIRWSALGVAAAVALMAVFLTKPFAPTDSPNSAVTSLRPTIRTLDDGSKVALRPGAAIKVDFSAGFRRVYLVRGEALFSVAKDAARPFIVRSGQVEVRAVGTEFCVDQKTDAVSVLVTEGRIAVRHAEGIQSFSGAAPANAVYATAGDRVVMPSTPSANHPPTVTAVTSSVIAQALAWRGERIEFSNTPLAEALDQINRGQTLHVVLAEPELGLRTLTGVLWADDSEGLVRLLVRSFDLKAERDGQTIRLRAQK